MDITEGELMKSVRKSKSKGKPQRPDPHELEGDRVDHREQLVNEGRSGPVELVSIPADMVTALLAIMLDVDPKFIAPELIGDGKGTVGFRLYKQLVANWLDHDPLFKKAEVRHSGTGVHVLFRFDRPVEFQSVGDRQRWQGVVKAIQSAIPTDPTAPGITALTRPVGSTNSKNGKVVKVLRPGTPVTADEVLDFYGRLRSKPFLTVARLLFGTDRVSPCPVCKGKGRNLAAGDRVGHCYGGCGKVGLADLLGTFMTQQPGGED